MVCQGGDVNELEPYGSDPSHVSVEIYRLQCAVITFWNSFQAQVHSDEFLWSLDLQVSPENSSLISLFFEYHPVPEPATFRMTVDFQLPQS